MAMLMQELIAAKRDGMQLDDEQIAYVIAGAADGSIPDYQVTAMLMAVYLRGMTAAELATWTDAMLRSGITFPRGGYGRVAIDKHSTGGVGDKISIPLSVAVGACGVGVPMISGRGLGHTGGTLDKLAAIPGFSTSIPAEQFIAQVRDIGVAMAGQTADLVPADRVLYALRDATATVASVPLISSSIMSKKLAEGIDGLVLDLKVGRAAFMRTVDEGRELAEAMRAIGAAAGVRVTVVMTRMEEPIGPMVGNTLEVIESVDVLHGGGPADTRELTEILGAEMLHLAGVDGGREAISKVLDDGSALALFRTMVELQGGDPRVADDPRRVLPCAQHVDPITAPSSGVIDSVDGFQIGLAALEVGGGRRVASDTIDPAVGVELTARVGAEVAAGEVIGYLHHNDRGVDDARRRIAGAVIIDPSGTPRDPAPRVLDLIRG